MINLNYDEGEIEFEINSDPNRVLRFNPNDFGFIERFEEFKNFVASQEFKRDADLASVNFASIKTLENNLRERLDVVFYPGACDVIFGATSLLGISKNGFVITNFLNAFAEEIAKFRKENVKKYTEKYAAPPPSAAHPRRRRKKRKNYGNL